MCLGIPGQVIRFLEGYHGQLAIVDVAGAERQVNIGMLEDDDLRAGDWVIIHMGFAIERVTREGAEEAMAGLKLAAGPPASAGKRLPAGDDVNQFPAIRGRGWPAVQGSGGQC